MRFSTLLTTAVIAGAMALSAPQGARAADAGEAILAEINFARAHPRDYAQRLAEQPVSDWERALGAGGPADDLAARTEAIDFLMRQAPLPPLSPDEDLQASAREHAAEQGADGAVGHDGPDGEAFDARIRRHGVEADLAAENIAYGPSQPADVVRELIIDSGVPGRGHRRNLFHPSLRSVGVACGPHRDFGAMCVMDFAGRPLQPRLELAAAASPPAPFAGDWVLSRGR